MSIQTYKVGPDGFVVCGDGAFVRYDDHAAALSAMQAQRDTALAEAGELRMDAERLQSLVDNLAMLSIRLVARVHKYKRDDPVADQSYQFLVDRGLQGSVLR